MPKFPDYTDVGRAARMNTGNVARAPQSALPGAFARLGGTLAQEADANADLSLRIGRKNKDEADALELTKARSDWNSRRLNEDDQYQVEKNPKLDKWDAQYDTNIVKHRAASAKLISDPKVRAKFEAETEDDVTRGKLAVSGRREGTQANTRKAQAFEAIDNNVILAARPGLAKADYDKIFNQTRADIDNMVKTGVLTPAEAIARRQDFTKRVAIAKVQQDKESDPAQTYRNLTGGAGNIYYDKLRKQENASGSDTASPGTSSALGRYQFTKGTWDGVRRAHPDLALTADGRTNGDQQELAIRALTKDNAAILEKNGLPASEANLYMMHFMGAGGGPKILKADPEANAAALFPDAASANRTIFFTKDGAARSVAEVIALQTKGFSGQGGPPPDYYQYIEPEQRAALANAAEGEVKSRQNQIEADVHADLVAQANARKDDFSLQIEMGKLVNEKQILDDPLIDNGEKATLLGRFKSQQESSLAASELRDALSAGIYIDGSDPKIKKGMDKIFKDSGGSQSLMNGDNKTFAVALDGWQKSAVLADDAKKTLQTMIRSPDDKVMVRGLAYLDEIQRRNPAAFDAAFPEQVSKTVQRYNDMNGFTPPNLIGSELRKRNDPEWIKSREPLLKAGQAEAAKSFDAATVVSMFDDRSSVNFFSSAPTAVAGDASMMATDFQRVYAEAYAEIGDAGQAKINALENLKKVWSPSELNGGAIMKHPPERYYGPSGIDGASMEKQLKADLKELGYVTVSEKKVNPKQQVGIRVETPRSYSLRAIPLTEAQISSGQLPQYAVIVVDPETGIPDAVTDKNGAMMVWPSAKTVQTMKKSKAATFNAARAKEQMDRSAIEAADEKLTRGYGADIPRGKFMGDFNAQ